MQAFLLHILSVHPSQNRSAQVKFSTCDLWPLRAAEESLSSTLQQQTDSYLESPAPQNTRVIHDSVCSANSSFFGFLLTKLQSSGTFLRRLSTRRRLHYSVLAPPFFVHQPSTNSHSDADRVSKQVIRFSRECPIFKNSPLLVSRSVKRSLSSVFVKWELVNLKKGDDVKTSESF